MSARTSASRSLFCSASGCSPRVRLHSGLKNGDFCKAAFAGPEPQLEREKRARERGDGDAPRRPWASDAKFSTAAIGRIGAEGFLDTQELVVLGNAI